MYICRFCGRAFTTKSAHTQHEKYHCENNPDRTAVRQTKFYTKHKKTACSNCGKLFDVANIKRHEASCGKVDNQYHVSHEGLECIFCGKTCKNKNSLTQHELRCRENPERKSWDCLANFIKQEVEALQDVGGLSKETCPRVAQAANTLSQRYKTGEIIPSQKGKPGTFLGRTHTEESKAKIRISTLKYLEDTVGLIRPRYNINACAYINILNSRFNWQLQHAENGGEQFVCGYFLDGYDSDLNIAFEYDESKHYADVAQNILCERDVLRMRSIMDELGCRFIRYNEKLDLLYEINSELTWQQI
jgi:hypothetical protein